MEQLGIHRYHGKYNQPDSRNFDMVGMHLLSVPLRPDYLYKNKRGSS